MNRRHDEQRRSWTRIEEDMVSALSVLNVKKYIEESYILCNEVYMYNEVATWQIIYTTCACTIVIVREN